MITKGKIIRALSRQLVVFTELIAAACKTSDGSDTLDLTNQLTVEKKTKKPGVMTRLFFCKVSEVFRASTHLQGVNYC